MPIRSRSLPPIILKIGEFALWTLLFAVAYSQSPLYTSNQNQYFLHGLANAGFGNLSRDWLANTLDPTPVFSLLVEATYRLVEYPPLYYFIYALLMGVYLFSLSGIVTNLYKWRDSGLKRVLFLALLITVHSAAWRFGLSRTLGVPWAYVLEDGFAGQRMLGPVLQPSAFGVFLVLSVYLYLRERPYLAVLSAVLAATVHPTYLLSAALLTGTYMLVILLEEGNFLKSMGLGLLALIFISPTLYSAINIFGGSSPEISSQARDILVNFRIPHHAIISEWFNLVAVVKVLLVGWALFLIRRTRLFLVMLLSALVLVGMSLLQWATGSQTLALLFPWRLSIYLLPLSTAIILAWLVDLVLSLPALQSPARRKMLLIAAYALVGLAVFIGILRFGLDLERKATAEERAVQMYVHHNLDEADIYLTPIKMQDFRLVSGAPVFVDFKSIPYLDSEVIEWHRRVQLADRFYESGSCEVLEAILREAQITHVVVENAGIDINCQGLTPVYQDRGYSIYRIERD